MPYNMMILYFHVTCFHVSNSALFVQSTFVLSFCIGVVLTLFPSLQWIFRYLIAEVMAFRLIVIHSLPEPMHIVTTGYSMNFNISSSEHARVTGHISFFVVPTYQ